MILKRPFALLIKHFRFIHMILSVFISYLVWKTSAMLSFITDYSVLPTTLIDPKTTETLFPTWLFLIPAFLTIGYVVILVLMRFKQKPSRFYFFSVLSMIFTIGVYVYARQTAVGLETALTDVRTLKLNQDLLRTAQIAQFVIAFVTIIRAIGFNIKKFDFSKDLEALAIEDADSEEFEVNLEVERESFTTRWRRFKRNTKYVLKENKMMITIICILLCFAIGGMIYLNKYVYHKVYKEGEIVETTNFYFTFQKSYKTFYDYRGDSILDTAYVIANFDVRKIAGKSKKIEDVRLYLEINNHVFRHDKELEAKFFDLGTTYNKEEIGLEKKNYSLFYQIPNNFMEAEMYIIYEPEIGEKKRIRIRPVFLDKAEEETKHQLKEKLDFQKTVLKNSTLTVKDYIISDYYKNEYTFCAATTNCYPSAEFIMPSLTDNYDKALMKIEAEFLLDDTVKIKNLKGFVSFLNSFAHLHYKVNEEEKVVENFKVVYPKSTGALNTYYIEVNKEIKEASTIWFEITMRDKKYLYYLK